MWSIASCEDGSWLASGGADSLICLWKVMLAREHVYSISFHCLTLLMLYNVMTVCCGPWWQDVTEKVVAEKQEARDRQILQ